MPDTCLDPPILVAVTEPGLTLPSGIQPTFRFLIETDGPQTIAIYRADSKRSVVRVPAGAGMLTNLRACIESDVLVQRVKEPEVLIRGKSWPREDLARAVREFGATKFRDSLRTAPNCADSPLLAVVGQLVSAQYLFLFSESGPPNDAMEALCVQVLRDASCGPNRNVMFFRRRNPARRLHEQPPDVNRELDRARRVLRASLEDAATSLIPKEFNIAHALRPGPIVIDGQIGSGKTDLARRIADRRGGNCVYLNAGAMTRELFESRLRGHDKGAFTGANAHSKGVLEEAHGGTLIVDEFQRAPEELQIQFLDLLSPTSDDVDVARIGSPARIRRCSVKVILVLNETFATLVEAGRIRSDLSSRVRYLISCPSLNDILLHLGHAKSKTYIERILRVHFAMSRLDEGDEIDGLTQQMLLPRFDDSKESLSLDNSTPGALSSLVKNDWKYGFRDLARLAFDLVECLPADGLINNETLRAARFGVHPRREDGTPVAPAALTNLSDLKIAAVSKALRESDFKLSKAVQNPLMAVHHLKDRGCLATFVRTHSAEFPPEIQREDRFKRLVVGRGNR